VYSINNFDVFAYFSVKEQSEIPKKGRMKTCLESVGGCFLCCFRGTRKYIQALVEHKYFQQGILLAILFNTLSMGVEYHNQVRSVLVLVDGNG